MSIAFACRRDTRRFCISKRRDGDRQRSEMKWLLDKTLSYKAHAHFYSKIPTDYRYRYSYNVELHRDYRSVAEI